MVSSCFMGIWITWPHSKYYVLNPATQQWVQLPPLPIPHRGMSYLDNLYLAFDPTLSSHFEVFQIPYDCLIRHRTELAPRIEGTEWPPRPCIFHVFSTRTKQWGGKVICSRRTSCRNLDQHTTGFSKFSAQRRLLAGGTLCTLPNQLCYEVAAHPT